MFPADHDDDAIPEEEHHFVQFSPTFSYYSNDDATALRERLEKQRPSAEVNEGLPLRHADVNKPPRRLIPYPYSKWDQPTAPSVLGVVGLAGAGLLMAILLALSVFVAWVWDFELPVHGEDDEPCPVADDACEGGRAAEAPHWSDCITGYATRRKKTSKEPVKLVYS